MVSWIEQEAGERLIKLNIDLGVVDRLSGGSMANVDMSK
jgi:hypothetical protein